MELSGQFETLVAKQKEDELLDLLKNSDPKERKSLVPLIRKLEKHYSEYKTNRIGSYNRVGSEKQMDMLLIAAFVSFSKADFQKIFFSSWILDDKRLSKVKDWFIPDWFGEFVNDMAKEEFVSSWINYDYIMSLAGQGLVDPSPSLIVKILPSSLFVLAEGSKQREWTCRPEILEKYPITFREHIWYLFEEESNLHYSDRFLNFGTKQKEASWISAFQHYAQTGQIERSRLLRESLQATNRNFNKVLTGWFAELFTKLEPSAEEIIALREELISVLNATQSKPVTMALQYLRKIVPDKNVDVSPVLDAIPAALASNTKTTVAAAIMLLEVIAKKNKNNAPIAARLCCQVFIHADDELQQRAAKLVMKYGSPEDNLLINELAHYKAGMLQGARQLLAGYLEAVEAGSGSQEAPEENPGATGESSELHPIPEIKTTSDLLFLCAQAFDNNESWHFDQLPGALVSMRSQIKGPVIGQLQPALQRALQTVKNSFRSTTGYFDHMLAVFFIDICVDLARRHPADATELIMVFTKAEEKTGDGGKWINIDPATSYLQSWKKPEKDPFYEPYKLLLLEALDKFRKGDPLPLLSTPTHTPSWISPDVLVERFAAYQDAGATGEWMDGQLALARCYTGNPAASVDLAKSKLRGEWKELMLFLLGAVEEPPGKITHPVGWFVASLSRNPKRQYPFLQDAGVYAWDFAKYTGQLPWKVYVEEYETNPYSLELKKNVRVMETRKIMEIAFPKKPLTKQPGQKKSILGKLLGKKKENQRGEDQSSTLYDFMEIKVHYLSNEQNDIRRALGMAPNNFEPLLGQIIHIALARPIYTGETDKRMAVATLQWLEETWDHAGEMAHLFLGTCMIAADKTTASLAAGIWVKHATNGRIDNKLLGHTIGKMEAIEFCPLKRLTDLVMQSMFNISMKHNLALKQVIENCLEMLPAEPVKNLKKLLEIYAELAGLTAEPVSEQLRSKLNTWKQTAGLNKVLGRLIP